MTTLAVSPVSPVPPISPVTAAIVSPTTDSDRLASIRACAAGFAQSDLFAENAVADALKAFAGCTFSQYNALQAVFVGDYMTARGATESAADKAFSRLKTAAMFYKPASPTGYATAVAAKRATAAKTMAAKNTADLTAERAAALTSAAALLINGKAAESIAATNSAQALSRELARRESADKSSAAAILKAARDRVIKLLASASAEQIAKCEAILTAAPVVAPLGTAIASAAATATPSARKGRKAA